jgi:large repetitive protein
LSRLFARTFLFGFAFLALAEAQVASTVTLASNQDPSSYGKPITLTATVTSGATGKVTFYDGVTVLGTSLLNSGAASLTTVLLPSGSRHLHARYSGDATYNASNSAVVPQTIAAQPSAGIQPAVPYNAGAFPEFIIVGDFNHDGHPDMIVTGTTAIFLGNGDGTFRISELPNLASLADGASGDFNEDGKLDLVLAGVEVALGNGDGTFQSPVEYATVGEIGQIAVADFNGDGHADIVAGLGGNGIAVLLGNGDGTFGAPTIFPATNASTVVVSDLNGDGNPDVVTGGMNDSTIDILLGNGDGTFRPVTTITAPFLLYTNLVVVADFNGDGKPDLGVGLYGEVGTYLGNGDGTFQLPRLYTTPEQNVDGITVADMNGDGKPDIILSYFDHGISVWLGNGDGTLENPVIYPTATFDPSFLVAADFNGDGKTDFATVMMSSNQVDVLIGGVSIIDLSVSLETGPGFTAGQIDATYIILVNNAGQLPTTGAVTVSDTLPPGFSATGISGTGWTCTLATLTCTRSDALAPGGYYPEIIVAANIGPAAAGSLTNTATVSGGGDQNAANNTATSTESIRPTVSISLASSPNPSSLGQTVTLTAAISPAASGEVTFYDGINILGSATIANGQAIFSTALLPGGSRNLSAVYDASSIYGPGYSATEVQTVNPVSDNGVVPYSRYGVDTGPQYAAAGDFNGDGIPDLVTANTGSTGTGTVSILRGNGDGTFQAAVDYPAGAGPLAVTVADFNRDGKADLAVTGVSGVYVLLGNGDGSFQAAVTYSQAGLSGISVADVNRDGIPDLLAVSANVGVSVLFGNGDGTFGGAVSTSIPGLFFWAVSDLNRDGTPDLIAGTQTTSSLTAWLGNADGTFQPPLNSPDLNGYFPSDLTAGDFNGDGKPDVAVFAGNAIQTLLGNGDGTFEAPIQSNVVTASVYAVTGDFNGDGKLDIGCAGNAATEGMSLFLGNGDGTFQTGAIYTTDGHPGNIVFADFNRDGKPDFAVPNLTPGNDVNVFLGLQISGLYIQSIQAGPFIPGGQGSFELIVSNTQFAGSSTGVVTVTDTLPAGLDSGGMSAPEWNCSTTSCTRSDALAAGQSYIPIDLFVSVSSNLSPGTVYNSASVSSSAGTNTVSGPTTIVALTPPVLRAPANGVTAPLPIVLSWNASTGATSYQVFLGTSMPLTQIATTAGSSVAAPSLSPGTLYYWQVIAQGSAGSAASGVGSFTTQSSTVDSFFNGEQILSSDWNYLQFPNANLFGYYAFLQGSADTSAASFYHVDLGYEYILGSTTGSAYFYDFATEHWWYTASTMFPYLYDFTLNSWIYYFPNTSSPGHYTANPRYFSNLTTGKIFTM